jgi:hypothetical protein
MQGAQIFRNEEYEYVAVAEDEPLPRKWTFYEAAMLVLRKRLHAPFTKNALNISIFVTAKHEEMRTTKGRRVLLRYYKRRNQMARFEN